MTWIYYAVGGIAAVLALSKKGGAQPVGMTGGPYADVLRWTDDVQRIMPDGAPFTVWDYLALMAIESSGDPTAKPMDHRAKEIGLYQVTTIAHADLYQLGRVTYSHESMQYDTDKQIDAGIKFLNLQAERTGFSLERAVKAYRKGVRGSNDPKFAKTVAEYWARFIAAKTAIMQRA